jgi:hypothetical protein
MDVKRRGSVKLLRASATVAALLLALPASALPLRPLTHPPGGGSAAFDPGGKESNHLWLWWGIDLNADLGVKQPILYWDFLLASPPPDGVWPLDAGEFYDPDVDWFTAPTYTPAYRDFLGPSYFYAAETPIDDFVAKLDRLRYVVDEGTVHEQILDVTDPSAFIVWRKVGDTIGNSGLFPDAWLDYPVAYFVVLQRPLSAGVHTVSASIHMTALHCDGIDTDPSSDCLPPGWSPITSWVVRVSGPH